MKTNRPQMILVAILVCLFAVGMAGLLNFFKYRSIAERIVQERLVATGQAIEYNIQSSLALGMSFSDIGTLPGALERERATDSLILSIDVLDDEGSLLYSTDRLRLGRPVPPSWLEAARRSNGSDWFVRDGSDSAATNLLKNSFGLTIGHVVVRYSDDQLKATSNAVAGTLALQAFLVFLAASTVASFALLGVLSRLSRHVDTVAAALGSDDPLASSVRNGPFGTALRRYVESVRNAETEIAILRGKLAQGEKR
jgi:hypothetical protein